MIDDYDAEVFSEIQLHGWNHGEVPALLFLNRNISHVAVRVYAYLQWRAGQKDSCFPGVARMGEELGIGERTIKGAFQELVDDNWIRRERRLGTSSLTHVFEKQEDCLKSGIRLPHRMGKVREVERTKDNELKITA